MNKLQKQIYEKNKHNYEDLIKKYEKRIIEL